MKVELPLGDVVDKIAILAIKSERIDDDAKLRHVRKELEVLRAAWKETGHPEIEQLDDWAPLLEVNGKLWEVEDDIRECERAQDFGEKFIELARSVYRLNDKRAKHKNAISVALGSDLLEQKSYKSY